MSDSEINDSEMNNSKIIIALDFNNMGTALSFVLQLDPKKCRIKVGKELFTNAGPKLVERFVGMGFDVFLDLKFHDIPNTVAKACVAAAELGVWMVNVHASGGRSMMTAAREALTPYEKRPLLIGVTVLTSLSSNELQEIGINGSPEEAVNRLAKLSQTCGLDGVVCSPLETTVLRESCGHDFTLVTPGVRPVGSNQDDQTRIMTPEDAIKNGSDFLVIGRPITQAENPAAALEQISHSINS